MKNIINIIKSKQKAVIITAVILGLLVTFLIPLRQYRNAAKTAETATALYLTGNYNRRIPNSRNRFLSFDEVYSRVKLKGFQFVVELGGSANTERGDMRKRFFYAKVEITPFTNKASIEKLILDNYNALK